jgi:hypothetical protein
MTTTKVLTPVAFVASFALAASPALAKRRGDGGRSDGRSRGSASRGAPSRSYSGYRGDVRGGRPYYARPYYSRPVYSFRPRINVGFGISMGYPVAYPNYDDDSPYRDVYPNAGPCAYEQAPSYGGSGYPAYGGSGYPARQSAPRVGVQRGGRRGK